MEQVLKFMDSLPTLERKLAFLQRKFPDMNIIKKQYSVDEFTKMMSGADSYKILLQISPKETIVDIKPVFDKENVDGPDKT